MNVFSKIQKLITHVHQNELLYKGKVYKAGAIREIPLKSSICEEVFSRDESIRFFYNLDATFELICDKCYRKYLDSFTVVSVEHINVNNCTAYGCHMKDGSTKDMLYKRQECTHGEIPEIFYKTIQPYLKKFMLK